MAVAQKISIQFTYFGIFVSTCNRTAHV